MLFAEQEANRSDVPSSGYLAGAKIKIISEVPANYKRDSIKLRRSLGETLSDGVTGSPVVSSLFQHHTYHEEHLIRPKKATQTYTGQFKQGLL